MKHFKDKNFMGMFRLLWLRLQMKPPFLLLKKRVVVKPAWIKLLALTSGIGKGACTSYAPST